jgi:hypothetical protein
MNRKEISLNIRVSKAYAMRMFEIGRAQDINKGGYCDASGAVINFWCGPENHPTCWNEVTIIKGGLNHPRDFVGTLRLYWISDDYATLMLEASPYPMERHAKGRPTDSDLDSCLMWLQKQVDALFNVADTHQNN